MLLQHYNFQNFSRWRPPGPPNERGLPPLILSLIAAFAAQVMPTAFHTPRHQVLCVQPCIISLFYMSHQFYMSHNKYITKIYLQVCNSSISFMLHCVAELLFANSFVIHKVSLLYFYRKDKILFLVVTSARWKAHSQCLLR